MWQADAMSDPTTAPRRAFIGLLIACALSLNACGGADSKDAGATPKEVLAQAKTQLDETTGLHLSLTTKDLPDGVQGITEATGVATSAPAFDGTISIIFAGQSVQVPVIAVDGKVFAQIPLTVGWSDVDPADYGAPDPAGLVSPETGFSSLLAATTSPTKGSSVRGGADNNEILTEYTGTVPGAAMKQVIPSATGDSFDAAYSITDEGELREARFTGEFYADSGPMTYTVHFDDYGTASEIVAPTTP
jgi:lipoprotein LprG